MPRTLVFLAQYLPEMIVIAAGIFLFLKKDLRFFFYCLTISLIALGLAQIVRSAVYVPRPFVAQGIEPLIPMSPESSFPSGHAAFTFTFAFSFWQKRRFRMIAGLFFVAAVVVSILRVAGLVHSPTDIIGGCLLAVFLVFLLRKPLSFAFGAKLG